MNPQVGFRYHRRKLALTAFVLTAGLIVAGATQGSIGWGLT
jgi:hypothetical protein